MPSVKQWKAKKWFRDALALEEPQGLCAILYYSGNYPKDHVFGERLEDFWSVEKTVARVLWQTTMGDVSVTNCIRAAFELGYIEQAMECQRLWDGRDNEN